MYTVNYECNGFYIQSIGKTFDDVLMAFEFCHDIAIKHNAVAVIIDEDGEVCDRVDGRG